MIVSGSEGTNICLIIILYILDIIFYIFPWNTAMATEKIKF